MLRRSITLAYLSLFLLVQNAAPAPTVKLSVDKTTVGMGGSVTLTTRIGAVPADSRAGYRVVPFVDGKRWGAIEKTNADGVTSHHLPLPTPGTANIQVLLREPVHTGPGAVWIWGPSVPERANHYLQRAFEFSGDPASAALYVAVDDAATLYLNGKELGAARGWVNTGMFLDLSQHLEIGPNVLSVEAQSSGGLGGLLVRLEEGAARNTVVTSDVDWIRYARAPYGWPFLAEEDGDPVVVLAECEWSPWRRTMLDWPTLEDRSLDIAGTVIPDASLLSDTVRVEVARRTLQRPPSNSAQRVGIQFEPWFTPHHTNWASSHAIPLTGQYWSWNTDVIRQQMIWLVESGIDYLVVDWTNHLWGKAHWQDRNDNTNEIIHATTQLLESLAQLRDEGQPVPAVALYLGLNNGPSTTVEAVNEALDWIYHNYVRNPRFDGLFESYLGKPLVLVHNGGGPAWVDSAGASRVDDALFTIRYQSFQHEFNDHAEHGFWSWMDATLEPVLTTFEDTAEALTVSSAFFSRGGWKKEGAHGRRGGWTMVESFKQAIYHRPAYLQIHQYQAFAGQWEGAGYGPDRDIFVDSYNVELSDDIEPVSLTAAAYRGSGGWGFYYLNLLRALVDAYQQAEPETTVLALDSPGYGSTITSPSLPLRWTWVGRAPAGFSLAINGKPQKFPPEAREAVVDIGATTPGPITITLTAEGTKARYQLSHTEAALPATTMAEASVSVPLVYRPAPEG